jgi:integrase
VSSWSLAGPSSPPPTSSTHTKTRALAQVAEGDARQLARVLTTQARRLVSPEDRAARRMAYGVADLILTSPPYACEVADINAVSGPEPLRRATMTVGETAMRPGEIFALHRPDVHMDKRLIHVRWQLDLITGVIT